MIMDLHGRLSGSLPAAIGQVDFSRLSIQANSLSGWSSMQPCTNMTSLNVEDNSFTELPTGFLPQSLERLVFDNNPIVTATPADIGAMLLTVPNLREVDMHLTMTPAFLRYGDPCHWQPFQAKPSTQGFENPNGCAGALLDPPSECHVGGDGCIFTLQLQDSFDSYVVVGKAATNLTLGLGTGRQPMLDNLDGTFVVAVPSDWIPVVGTYQFQMFHGNDEFGPCASRNGNSAGQTLRNPGDFCTKLLQVTVLPRDCPQGSHTEADSSGAECVCQDGFRPDEGVASGAQVLTCHRQCGSGTVVGPAGDDCVCPDTGVSVYNATRVRLECVMAANGYHDTTAAGTICQPGPDCATCDDDASPPKLRANFVELDSSVIDLPAGVRVAFQCDLRTQGQEGPFACQGGGSNASQPPINMC